MGWEVAVVARPAAAERGSGQLGFDRAVAARILSVLVVLALGAGLVLRALFTDADHDESQYIAGAALANYWVIFRDFMHLQTPLQALLFAPLAEWFPNHMFLAMRVANALLATGVLAVSYATLRHLGASRLAGAIAVIFLGLCQPFQYSAVLVRNDILPAVFSSLAVFAAVAAARGDRSPLLLWGLAGAAFGLATSAKVSHAFLAVAAGVFLLGWIVRARDRRPALLAFAAFGAGGIAGLLPSVVTFARAPEAFLWGVVEYGASAPFDWYRTNGLAHMLDLEGKLRGTLRDIGRSPVLPALLLVLLLMLRRRSAVPRREVVLLDVLVLGGLVAALLPTPTWAYYFMTLVPVLFVRFGLEIDRLRGLARAPQAALVLVFAASLAFTFNWRMRDWLKAPPENYAVPKLTAQAHWIGQRLRAAGAEGAIATVAPLVVLDSGYPLDRRFAPGVFVYRSGNLLTPAEHERFNTVGPETLAGYLDRSQPAAIVTGYENGSSKFKIFPDVGIRAYAVSRGYRLEKSPLGGAELYINPRAAASARAVKEG